jgi:hypothetical protein
VLARDGYRCHICGLPGADSVNQLDPVATHGPAIPPADRLAAAHVACNTRRRHEIEQAQRAGRPPSHPARPEVITGPPGRRQWWGTIQADDLARSG